jgi:hypothetical protein
MAKVNAPSNGTPTMAPTPAAPPPAPFPAPAAVPPAQSAAPLAPAQVPNAPYLDPATNTWMFNGQPLGAPAAPAVPAPAAPAPQFAAPVPALFAQPAGLGAPAAPSGGIGAMMSGMGGPSGGGGIFQSVNWGDVSEGGGGALLDLVDDKGNPIKYEGRIDKASLGTSSAGNQMVSIEVVVTYPLKHAGARLYDTLTFTDKSVWKVKSCLRACGLLSEDGNSSLAQSEQELVDNIVRFGIKNEEYDGALKSKIATGYSEGFETPGLVPPVAAAQAAVAAGVQQPNFGPA